MSNNSYNMLLECQQTIIQQARIKPVLPNVLQILQYMFPTLFVTTCDNKTANKYKHLSYLHDVGRVC